MAIQQNGQPASSLVFVDNKPGTRVFIGEATPTGLVDGDIWIDADTQNNAGKNLLSTTNLTSGNATTISLAAGGYKDIFIVFRGITVSTAGNLFLLLNENNTNYVTGTTLFSLANFKAESSTSHWTVELTDTAASSVFTMATLRGIYTTALNADVILNQMNAFTLTSAVTSMTITASAGTFTGGTILVYGVN